jgi:hypothetical protein
MPRHRPDFLLRDIHTFYTNAHDALFFIRDYALAFENFGRVGPAVLLAGFGAWPGAALARGSSGAAGENDQQAHQTPSPSLVGQTSLVMGHS